MKQTILSEKQSEVLENLIAKYGQIVTSSQIYQELKNTFDYQQTKNLVSKLVKNGWLVRIKRELYAISDLSSRGYLNLSPYVVANLLLPESYVSFESALAYHGMFDQLTSKSVSLSLKMHKAVELAGVTYTYVMTKPDYFFGWQEVTFGSLSAKVATPEKALVDMVNFHKSQYSIDLVIEKLVEHKQDLDLDRLTSYLCMFPSTAIKTYGLLFDLLGIDSDKLHKLIDTKRSTSWMLPGDSKFNARWRLYYRAYFDKYQTSSTRL